MRWRAGLLALGLILIAGFFGVFGLEQWAVRPLGANQEPHIFVVAPGATGRRIIDELVQQGFGGQALPWKAYLRLHPGKLAAKAGKHALHHAMSPRAVLEALSGPPLPDDIPITLVEGWRLRDADAHLAAEGVISPGAYLAATRRVGDYQMPFRPETEDLAGYLLPDTYHIPKAAFSVERLVQRQLDAFAERFYLPNRDAITASGRSLHELVVMASLLEREEPKPERRNEVAGVLFKRLDAGMALGVDATSRFHLDRWNDRRAFLKALRDPTDPYNTRLRTGLPPGPIGAPSLASLLAALRPKSTPYWYYLHDKDQNIHFARDARGHEANRRKFNVW